MHAARLGCGLGVQSSVRKPPGSTYVKWMFHSALTSWEKTSVKPSTAHLEAQYILKIGTLCEYRC